MTTLPLGPTPRFVTETFDVPSIDQIDVYRRTAGTTRSQKALATFQPDDLVEEVKKSGLRGRGGAGFATGVKWSFLPQDQPQATLSGGQLRRERARHLQRPHAYGGQPAPAGRGGHHHLLRDQGPSRLHLHPRRAAPTPAFRSSGRCDEAYAAGFVGKNILGSGFDLEITVHHGAGAYICGEESALLESLEGKRGYPRLKPPFPAVVGLYGGPTVINNVETLATVPAVVHHGADVYAAYGTEKSKGTRIYCLSGHVNRPGNYELPLGTPLRALIEDYGGGVRMGRKLKAFTPGGSSAPLLGPDKLDIPLDYEAVAAAGSMLGSGGVIVLDDQTCIVGATLRMTEFYRDESCGKCTPCREGTFWLVQLLERLEEGEGRESDVDLLLDICDNIAGEVFCPLGDAATSSIVSSIKLFRDEYIHHVREHACLVGPGAHRAHSHAAAG